MTLEEHLAAGYDYFTHGVRAADKWSPETFAAEMREDKQLWRAAIDKQLECSTVVSARGEMACHVTKVQARILRTALEKV